MHNPRSLYFLFSSSHYLSLIIHLFVLEVACLVIFDRNILYHPLEIILVFILFFFLFFSLYFLFGYYVYWVWWWVYPQLSCCLVTIYLLNNVIKSHWYSILVYVTMELLLHCSIKVIYIFKHCTMWQCLYYQIDGC